MEKMLHWQHPEKIAEGWLVIDKLINGVSGGGTFMHPDATLKEVADLARNMTYKNQLNKIPFGGGKAGIRFDHRRPEAKNILSEFLLFCKPYLLKEWSTGADLNTDSDVIDNIVKSFNIDSSFFALGQLYADKLSIPNQSSQLRERVSLPINQYFTLEQAIVGHSLIEVIQWLVKKPLRLVLQGFGKIGSSFAYFLEQKKVARIVGIGDVTGALLSNKGLSITSLLDVKNKNPAYSTLAQLCPSYAYAKDFHCQWLPNEGKGNENLLAMLKMTRADVVSFCANRYAITPEVLDILLRYTYSASQKKFLICGANLPFSDTALAEKASAHGIVCLPSWFTSSGNSLLYAEALSVSAIDSDWPFRILHKIAGTLIQTLDSSIIKNLSDQPHDWHTSTALLGPEPA